VQKGDLMEIAAITSAKGCAIYRLSWIRRKSDFLEQISLRYIAIREAV